MSITETINEAKKELSNDEHILASAFKLEKLYQKHKLKLFTVIAVVVLYFVGTTIMNSFKEQKLVAANSALLSLEKDANNTTALNELKSNNPALFELYSYKKAIKNADTTTLKTLSKSKNEIIADIATYHLDVLEAKPSQSKLYSDVSHVNNAYLLIKEGKITQAKEELELISEDSPVHNIAQIIKHYTIKGQ